MNDCFGRGDTSLTALSEIDYLLDYREIEVRPFHGSLFAYVSELPDHAQQFASHAPVIRQWLELDAPEYWRWAWLWVTKAQLGSDEELLVGPETDWAVDALVAGYPIEQVINILDHAEKIAFERFDLPRLLELRSLKTRALNGPEFQTDEWELFPEVAALISSDPAIPTLLRSDLKRAPAKLLPFIARSADSTIRTEVANGAIDELNHRIRYKPDGEIARSDRQETLAASIVGVVAALGMESTYRVVRFAKGASRTEGLLTTYARASLLAGNFENAFAAGEAASGNSLAREVFAGLCLEGLTPSARPALKAHGNPLLATLEHVKTGTPPAIVVETGIDRLFEGGDGEEARFAEDTREILRRIFFSLLNASLAGGAAEAASHVPEHGRSTWLAGVIGAFERLADRIAADWRTDRKWPKLKDVILGFDAEPSHSRSHEIQRRIIAARLALMDIAVDLCTIAKSLDASVVIDADDLEVVSSSPFWLDELWLDAFATRRLPLHSPAAIKVLVERYGQHLDATITNFSERTDTSIKLALVAADHGLVDLARHELRRAAGCLLGYGWRKDMYAFEVLESLDRLADRGFEEAKRVILSLAGPFEAITEYTDGDETNHVRSEYYEAIAKYFPERVAACYAHLIQDGDWHYAESLLIEFAKLNAAQSAQGAALLETFIVPSELQGIADTDCHPDLASITAKLLEKTGRASAYSKKEREASSSSFDADKALEGKVLPKPVDFEPGRLREFVKRLRDLRDYSLTRNYVAEWLEYWDAQGRALDALNDFGRAVATGGAAIDAERTFDKAFEISLRVEGRSKAFKWLIEAHVDRSGWSRWWTSNDEAQARMKIVAQTYPGQWRDFIRSTSRSRYSFRAEQGGILIGLSRLVFFLLQVGEEALALEYTLRMAEVFRREVSEQPIAVPDWSK